MNLGRIATAPCNNTPPVPDARCVDPVFALLNPNICGVSSQLIIKPQVALCCLLGGVQFKAFVVTNGVEQDVTASTQFTTSNPAVAVIGASSGNATGLADGEAVITATYNSLTANASVSVLGDGDGSNCCDEIKVGMMVVLDISASMTQAFGGAYPQKLNYAKAAAKQFISQVNTQKDVVGLATFDDSGYTQLSGLSSNAASVAAMVDAIGSNAQLTGFSTAVNSAMATLAAGSLDSQVLVIISDGTDTSQTANDANSALTTLNAFKANGGVVIVLGVRTSGSDFSFLEAASSGGFFVSAYPSIAADALTTFCALKGYVCAGNCVPAGDDFEAKGQLNYCAFKNWNVRNGHVDLIGNGFLDFLPGNGLYVDLAGASAPHGGVMESKNSYALISGHSYRLSLSLAGNQRFNGTPNTVGMRIFGRNNDGLTNPELPPILTVNQSGAVITTTPTYKYVYTYVNANGETALSPSASATPTTANASITVQAAASASATAINIYRTTGISPDSAYYLIATIAPAAPAYIDHMNEADMLAAFLAGTLDACLVAPASNTTGSQVNYLNQSVTINDYQQPFEPQSFTFTAPDNISVWIQFQQTAIPSGAPSAGLLLDNVSFDDTTNIVNLLSDDFSLENLTYIPPACGAGATPYHNGFQYANNSVPAIFPVMTSNTSPSGVASDSNGDAHAYDPMDGTGAFHGNIIAGPGTNPAWWIQYRFLVPGFIGTYFIATSYTLKLQSTGSFNAQYQNPTAWVFQGSNDGATWTTLDNVIGSTAFQGSAANTHTFNISNATGYQYYRLTITSWIFTSGMGSSQGCSFGIFSIGGTGNSYYQTTVWAYGYAAGYYGCYGTGCLDTPPPTQLPDPSPLPNIETPGYTPPKQYSSSQQACISCPDGSTNFGAGLIPVMTSNTAPSGVAAASSIAGANSDAWRAFQQLKSSQSSFPWSSLFNAAFPQWLSYGFGSVTPVSSYMVEGSGDTGSQYSPSAWTFEGSPDGVTWTILDTQSGIGWFVGEQKNFALTASASYRFYRLNISAAVNINGPTNPSNVTVYQFQVYNNPAQVCKSATASSLVSQADADSKARAAATAAATASLNCVTSYSATESVVATCPLGQVGQPVTETVTYISFISLSDAQNQARALATAQGNAALVCVCSDTSAGKITINDFSAATPYPAVKCVSGLTGHITKVTASITGFQHTYPNDVSIMLISPSGTKVNLMTSCGGTVLVTGINLTFDDAAGGSLTNTSLASGTFKPTQIGSFLPFPLPCPSGAPNLVLSALIGENPNGAWKLYVQDTKQLDVGLIAGGFSLVITSS